jgi:hypothetical protein
MPSSYQYPHWLCCPFNFQHIYSGSVTHTPTHPDWHTAIQLPVHPSWLCCPPRSPIQLCLIPRDTRSHGVELTVHMYIRLLFRMSGDLLLLTLYTLIIFWLFVGKILNRYISVNTKYVTYPKTHTGLIQTSHSWSIPMSLRKVALLPLSGKNRNYATCYLVPGVETELVWATQQRMFVIFYFLFYYGKPVPVAARSKAYVCGRSPAEIVVSNSTGSIDVCRECCVLSGRGLCDELITRLEEYYRIWCVVVCDIETSRMRRPWLALGRSAQKNYYGRKLSFQRILCF